ncbi:MAG: tRNA uridine-5-carboxymethylaminomethyl(34) synthesis GTPase MnmE [Methylacidiphilales bacterium]|nr:tRNA uridine-5-carboxymethylaminomethyl(34) synthesis GTPase MnmE [Candidatus Methylacidiphilales bacterium]
MANDTIIALSTPPGPAALALLRLSGPQSHAIIQNHINSPFAPQHASFARFRSGTEIIDEVVATFWKSPASYTGEDMVEISCHGNMLIVERILQTLCQSGARPADPGEFTQRAFLNGKMDLTQAEAVMDLIHARSERALRAAHALQNGRLGQILQEERENLLQVLSHLEAFIDFPDEDITPDVSRGFIGKIKQTRLRIQNLLASAREGKWIRSGLSVVITGAPNSGKSSLLNALLERDRAIVSPIAGTTRDTIEEVIFLEGIAIRLTDSAGLRENPDEIEKLGIERTRQALNEADLILFLIDGSDPSGNFTAPDFPEKIPLLACLTKSDLPRKTKAGGLALSARSGTGLAELKSEIVKILRLNESSAGLDHVAINSRHESLLREAVENLDRALEMTNQKSPPELISSDLRQALNACGKIVGEATNEDMLDRLFKNFCIGK